jgi:hypothetical protein
MTGVCVRRQVLLEREGREGRLAWEGRREGGLAGRWEGGGREWKRRRKTCRRE